MGSASLWARLVGLTLDPLDQVVEYICCVFLDHCLKTKILHMTGIQLGEILVAVAITTTVLLYDI